MSQNVDLYMSSIYVLVAETHNEPAAARQRKASISCKPDRSSFIDLCHHLLPPADGSIVSHLPQGVVLHNVALSKGGAGAT